MDRRTSLVEAVRTTAVQHPDRVALRLPGTWAGAPVPEPVRYHELDHRASAIAAWLILRGLPGRPVLVTSTSGVHFATALLGCLYAGAVAVPAAPPDGRLHRTERLLGIIRDSAAAAVLTCSGEASGISRLLTAAGLSRLDCLAIDTARLPDPADPADRPGPDHPALLQYTVGRAAGPVPTVVTHRMLTAGQQSIARTLRTAPGDTVGGWLPHHHGTGLTAQLLHGLWLGGTAVLLPPEDFRRDPLCWLDAIGRYRVVASTSPGYGYEECVRAAGPNRLTDTDLSYWRTAASGTEPPGPEVMRSFALRFAHLGFRAEALASTHGLAGTGVHLLAARGPVRGALPVRRAFDRAAMDTGVLRAAVPGTPARTLVSAGRPAGPDLRIADPRTGNTLPEGRIGEVRVRARSVSEDDRCHPTGALGGLLDGDLFITGRTDEGLPVAGLDVHPSEIERAVRHENTMLGAAAAFPVPDREDGQQVVVVQEVRTDVLSEAELSSLAGAIRRCTLREFALEPYEIVLVRPGTLRRALGGPAARGTVRDRYLAGRILPLHRSTAAG